MIDESESIQEKLTERVVDLDVAKGRYKYPLNAKEMKNTIKRSWYGNK